MIAKRKLILIGGLLGTALGLGVVGLTIAGPRWRNSAPAARVPKEMLELEDTLEQIKRAWNPRVKARVFAQARSQALRLAQPLLRVLKKPKDDRLPLAISLAAELGVKDLRPALVELTRHAAERLRPAAIVAAGRLEPWSRDALVEFFQSTDPAVREVAVRLTADAPDTPHELLSALFVMLGDPEATVRDATLEAIPKQIPDEARKALLEQARMSEGVREVWTLRALGRIALDEPSEAILTEKLDTGDYAVRGACLESLSTKAGPLRQPSSVWALAIDSSGDPIERSRAFSCLERTRSAPVAELARRVLFVEHPLPRYFAARCLVAAGEKQGAEILIELLEADVEELGDLDGVDAQTLQYAVRALLAELSGSGLGADPETWIDWARKATPRPRILGPSPLGL